MSNEHGLGESDRYYTCFRVNCVFLNEPAGIRGDRSLFSFEFKSMLEVASWQLSGCIYSRSYTYTHTHSHYRLRFPGFKINPETT